MDELSKLFEGFKFEDLLSERGVLFTETTIGNEIMPDSDGNDEDDDKDAELLLDIVCDFKWKPFKELEAEFDDLPTAGGLIKKNIIIPGNGVKPDPDSKVKILYSVYVEGNRKPIESTSRNYFKCDLSEGSLLPGISTALLSMGVGERSQFLIHHSLMYGEVGSPPIIPTKARCLLNLGFMAVLEPREDLETPIKSEYSLKFAKSIDRARKMIGEADFINGSGDYNKAVRSYEKIVNFLRGCSLADDREERVQIGLLRSAYKNLGICHVKLNQPLQACKAFNDYHRLGRTNDDCELLFNEGKALLSLSEHERAMRKFNRALKLQPKNKDILEEIKLLKNMEDMSERRRKKISDYIQESDEEEHNAADEVVNSILESQVSCLEIDLPPDLTDNQVDYIKNKLSEYGFNVSLGQEADVRILSLSKDD